jgi:hypothetical protein
VLMLTIHRSALQTQKISQAKMLKPVSMGCILLLALRSDVFRVTNSANISFSMREEVESYERERRNWMLESRQFGGVGFLVLGLVSLTDSIPLCRRPIWSHESMRCRGHLARFRARCLEELWQSTQPSAGSSTSTSRFGGTGFLAVSLMIITC